jgi:hypothetical protein
MPVDLHSGGSVRGALALALLLVLVASACASLAIPPQDAPAQGTPPPSGQKWGTQRKTIKDFGTPDDGTPPPKQDEETAAKPSEPAKTTSTWSAAPADSTGLPDWIHGSLTMRYRGRWNDGGHDNDLGGILALDLADPNSSRISGHFQGRVDADLDGKDSNDGLGSLDDTYDRSVVSKIYLAYADVAVGANAESRDGTLRVGRQSDPRLPEVVRLDGLSYSTAPLGKNEVELGLYGGVPVHLYDSSREGDSAFGTYLEGIPWKGGRARFDWMHLEDENVLGAGEDDLLVLSAWQELTQHARFEGVYSNLEGDPRDLRLRALFDDPETQTNLRLGYYQLLTAQKALVTELDPFYEQLLEYEPYRETNFNLSHAFGAHTIVDAGFDLRRVSESGDVGEFNRNWQRFYATATFSDVAAKGLAFALTADRWDDSSRDINTFGADVSYSVEKQWRASVGSYFSMYKYDFLELAERDDVRTYYLRTTYDLTARTELEFLYEFEDADLDTFQTVRVGARWRF